MLKALFVPVLVTTLGLFFGVAGCTDNSGNGKYSNDSGATLGGDGAAGNDAAVSEGGAGGSEGGGEVAPTPDGGDAPGEAAADTPAGDVLPAADVPGEIGRAHV